MKNLFLLLFTFAMLILLSCKNNNSNPVNPLNPGDTTKPHDSTLKDVIWPLAVGNSWKLRYSIVKNNNEINHNEIDESIIGEKIINNEKQFLLSAIGKTGYMVNRKDGLWVSSIDDTTQVSLIWFKYPVMLGDTFYSSHDHVTYEVKLLDTIITIKTGNTYHCIKYMSTDGNFISFLSPNVGPIKGIIRSFDGYTYQYGVSDLIEPPILK